MPEIGNWLEGLGLARYRDVLAENDIDFRVLPELTEADLRELGLTLGHRKLLLKAIRELDKEASPAMADAPGELPHRSPRSSLEPERRQLTVLFCDLVGSTAMSQQLDPEDLGDVIRMYQDACTGMITRLEGYVARYMGDGILAYFGYPVAHEDNAERAVQAGLNIVGAVEHLTPRPNLRLQVRVGVATGLSVVGEAIGEGPSAERAALGETPNLAARLQGIAQADQIVICDRTRRLIGERFAIEEIGVHRLKGIDRDVPAWKVIAERASKTRFEARGARLAHFVGRSSELHMLAERWGCARNGEGQLVLLSGEAGIGKSRLVQAFRDTVSVEDHIHTRFQCSPYHTNSAFYPIARHLEWVAGILPDEDNDAKLDKLESLLHAADGGMRAVIPYFAGIMGIPFESRYGGIDLPPEGRKRRTLEALTGELLALADERPVLCVFEDVHWIDPTTEEMLQELVGRIATARILVLITHRPEWKGAWAAAYGHAVALSLSRLSNRDAVRLVRAIVGNHASPGLIERVTARTDGIPLFVEELTRSLIESEANLSGGNDIPDTLQASLLARLDRLEDAKAVAQVGAVIGRQFSYRVLRAVVDQSDSQLTAALHRLNEAQLVFRHGDPPEAVYTFKHALIRDAAYDSLLKRRRQALHGRLAKALERAFPHQAETEPELLAHHFTEAEDLPRAVAFWTRAGQLAISRSAYQEAITHLTKGLELLASMPDSVERADQELTIQTALAAAFMATGGWGSEEADTATRRASALSRQVGDADRLFKALVGRRYSYQIRGDTLAARDVGSQCLDLAIETGNPVYLVQAHVALAHTAMMMGEFAASRVHIRQVVTYYDKSQHPDHVAIVGLDPGVFASATAGTIFWISGFPDQARAFSEGALELAGDLAHPQSIEQALDNAAFTHHLRREPDIADEYARRALAIGEERGFRMRVIMAGMLRAWTSLAKGKGALAVSEFRNGLEAYGETGARAWLPYYLALLAKAYLCAGDPEPGLSVVDEALDIAEARSERWWNAELHRVRGQLLLSEGKTSIEDAESCFQRALEAAREQGAKAWELRAATSLARLWSTHGKAADAQGVLTPVLGWFSEGFDAPDMVDARSLLDELQ